MDVVAEGARRETPADSRAHPILRRGVATMLLALVAIPLGVLGARTYVELSTSGDELASVRDIVPVTEDRIRAIRLTAALADERTFAIAMLGVEAFGVDSQMVEDLIGIDIAGEYERSRATTDELTAGLRDYPQRVAAVRAERTDMRRIAVGYRRLGDDVAAIGDRASARLELLVVGRPDADELLRRLSMIQAAAQVQTAVDNEFAAFIGSRLAGSLSAPTEQLQAMVENRRTYDQAVAELEELVVPGPVAESLRRIRASSSEHMRLRLVDGQIETALEHGISEPDAALPTEEAALFEDAVGSLDQLQHFLDAARRSSVKWVDLTGMAGQELVHAAVALEDQTEDSINSSRLVLIATGVATLLATLAVAGLISRSMRHLARGAQRLRDGDTRPFRPSGPREVYVAGVALSEAGTNFNLLQRQADTLAQGRLDDHVLEQAAPGELGATLKRVVDRLSDSIQEREEAQADVAWQANHDRMTGLQNRAAATDLVREALYLPRPGEIAVVMVDLDGFKSINDVHGHRAGDEVLIEIGARLHRTCRPGDEVCRMGGDEFVVLLAGPMTEDDAVDIATRVSTVVAEPFLLTDGIRVNVRASVGVAISSPDSTVARVLKEADLAVHEAKRSGRNRLVLCTQALIDANRRSGQIANDIVAAIDNDELRVEYQPVVHRTGAVVGLEALARWTHPAFGPVPPDEFIAVAERNGSIVDVDRWVIRSVVDQLAAWSAKGGQLADLPVAVNISTRHLVMETAVDDVLEPLRAAQVTTDRLSIEVTETALIEDMDDVRRNLAHLREAGVRIAIDDFGTGYAAISQLRALPVDVVKIDRSFVSRVTDTESSDAALVQLIIDIAHLLGAHIVAEGIETAEQAAVVAHMGADAQQGWLYSRSVTADRLGTVVADLDRLRHSDATRPLTAGSR